MNHCDLCRAGGTCPEAQRMQNVANQKAVTAKAPPEFPTRRQEAS